MSLLSLWPCFTRLYLTIFLLFSSISTYNAFTIGSLPSSINQKSNLVSISPGGLTGFYTLGITSYLKSHYNLSDYVFLGASAGSWNALLLTSKIPNEIIVDNLLNQSMFQKSTTISSLHTSIKNYIIDTYDTSDFNLNKLFISVSVFRYFYFKPKILFNFKSLKDAVEGCMSSSYIPMVTGGIRLTRIKNLIVDGGWPKFPPDNIDPYFSIEPSMWGKQFKREDRFKYPSNVEFFRQMYQLGYNDSHTNKKVFDLYFHKLNIHNTSCTYTIHNSPPPTCLPGAQYYS